jgi:hypothetical protein
MLVVGWVHGFYLLSKLLNSTDIIHVNTNQYENIKP